MSLRADKASSVSTEPRVAVIDDDDPFRVALVESLDSLAYRTCAYASADEFISAAGETSCDCVVTDIHMPGMSGIDLKLLLAARGSKMPVIMITARSDPELEAKAMASGAICLLRKPFDSAALVHCLDLALNA
jgi:FixJ family two-component response regulator